jgi:hypothetical protein
MNEAVRERLAAIRRNAAATWDWEMCDLIEALLAEREALEDEHIHGGRAGCPKCDAVVTTDAALTAFASEPPR